MSSTVVPPNILLKAIAAVNVPCLMVMAVLVVIEELGIVYFLVGYTITLVLSFILVYPFLINITQLTKYVSDLASDKFVTQPNLGHVGMMFDLEHELNRLQALWDTKRLQLKEQISEHNAILDMVSDIILIINKDKLILNANRAARTLFGQNLGNRFLTDIISDDGLLEAIKRTIDKNSSQEVEFHVDEPFYCDFLTGISPLVTQTRKTIVYIITMTNITELKSVDRMRANFVTNASHELNSPLTTLVMGLENIQNYARNDPAALDLFLGIMAEQSDRMRQLINDMLNLSKIDANAHTVPIDPVNFYDVIYHEVKLVNLMLGKKAISIELDVENTIPLVRGDKNELAQIVHNLITNAIKYSPSGTVIRVAARVTTDLPSDNINMQELNRAMMLSVRDQGEGIAAEDIARLTERFFRVDTVRTESIGGMGLGLSIVNSILNRHRGAISIYSTLGQGSCFNVFLPLYDD
jgi:two-component system, OmpR family, phosphate regulon sensor histidine kinase PhoR